MMLISDSSSSLFSRGLAVSSSRSIRSGSVVCCSADSAILIGHRHRANRMVVNLRCFMLIFFDIKLMVFAV